MEFIYNEIFREHDTGTHPENAERLTFLKETQQTQLPDAAEHLDLVHTREYIADIKDRCRRGGGLLDGDTVVSPRSYEAAVAAVAAAIKASDNNGFAMVRPPGHHAFCARASGFCLFNNIAVASALLARAGQRVLILDFDGHCGDGTEDFFYRYDSVMYCSLHQYPAFPFTGTVDDIGAGKGEGYTINVPLPPYSGDDLFWKGMQIILQAGEQFAPDVVAVSAGFDGHHDDPLLQLRLSTTTFYELGTVLSQTFPRVFAVLEGGYNLESLANGARNFRNGINGEPPAHSEPKTDSMIQAVDEFDHRLFDLEHKLQDYWKFT